MKNLLNRLIFSLYINLRKVSIKRLLLIERSNSIVINPLDIVILKVDREDIVHDNDLDKVKSYATHKVLNDMEKMLNEGIINIKYEPEDLDNNFKLRTTAKLTVLKRNNK